jgi:hypothetical protein
LCRDGCWWRREAIPLVSARPFGKRRQTVIQGIQDGQEFWIIGERALRVTIIHVA